MFWNDPNLYGVSLPYKDIANPMATTGWHNIPRFLPPTYGFTPPFMPPQGFPTQPFTQQPFATQPFAPMAQPFTPMAQPFATQPITPMAQPFTPMAQPFATQPITPMAQPFTPMAQPFATQPFTPMAQPFGNYFRPEQILPPVLGMNPYFQAYNVMPQPFHPFRPFQF